MLDIEGYAMIGYIDSYSIDKCSKKKYRMRARLRNGVELCSPCIDYEELNIARRVIDFYTKAIKGLAR